MTDAKRTLLLSLICLSVCGGSVATEASQLDSDIQKILQPYLQANDFMGVVGVQRDGESATLVSVGLAGVELDVPHEADHIFMIGSVSKQFTAAAILLLEEDGALRTTDPVAQHLPDFPGGADITLEQLLTHTSGVADIYSLDRFGRSSGRDNDFAAILADVGRAPRTHEPGQRFLYSNGGYSVLAAVIEAVSGQSYGSFLAARVFEPLGMRHTADDALAAAVPGRVPGYDPWGARDLMPAVPVSPAFTRGSGSLWSSASDLLRWSQALHGGEVLQAGSYEKLVRNHGNGYGFGVSPFQRFGRSVIGHDGRVSGFTSDLARYVDDRLTVVVLGNVQSACRDEIRRLVAAAALDVPYEIPAPRRFVSTSSRQLDNLVGVYAFGPSFDVTISIGAGRLLARANQGGTSELVALEDGVWFSRMLYASVRFGRDDDGRVDRLLWGLGDGAPVGKRKD